MYNIKINKGIIIFRGIKLSRNLILFSLNKMVKFSDFFIKKIEFSNFFIKKIELTNFYIKCIKFLIFSY